MANICNYHGTVKGKLNACTAFIGSLPCYDDKGYGEAIELGNGEWEISFSGDCKWSLDYGCTPWRDSFPAYIPEDPDEAMDYAMNHYWYHTVQELSKMFEVEVSCYSTPEEFETICEHYINGIINSTIIDDDYEAYSGYKRNPDRIEAYACCEPGAKGDDKFFMIKYENPVLTQILEKYNYKFTKLSSYDCADGLNEFDVAGIEPDYAGVTNLSELTTTLINIYLFRGEADKGFADELRTRKQEIIKGFSSINGTSQESWLGDGWCDGYNFKLENGIFEATYRQCKGGW